MACDMVATESQAEAGVALRVAGATERMRRVQPQVLVDPGLTVEGLAGLEQPQTTGLVQTEPFPVAAEVALTVPAVPSQQEVMVREERLESSTRCPTTAVVSFESSTLKPSTHLRGQIRLVKYWIQSREKQ